MWQQASCKVFSISYIYRDALAADSLVTKGLSYQRVKLPKGQAFSSGYRSPIWFFYKHWGRRNPKHKQ